MSAVRTTTAAAMLGVSPSTLRSWERRHGFPRPRRSDGGQRRYELDDLTELREALARTGGEIAAAAELVRSRGRPVASPLALREAFAAFDSERADRLVEESLAIRSLERTVDELALDVFAALDERSAEQEFAARWMAGWLAAARRAAPAASREECVLIFDFTRTGSLDCLQTQSLELFLRRAGLRALTLAGQLDLPSIARAVRTLRPVALVLAGTVADLDGLGRLVFAARQASGQLPVFDFRGAVPDTGASTVGRLAASALAASGQLVEQLAAPVAQRPRRSVAS
jgi:DNA-binding transcriptional MerR regulator